MAKKKRAVPEAVKQYFSSIGKRYGAMGGFAAAANMTDEQKVARAKKAVAQREANRAAKKSKSA